MCTKNITISLQLLEDVFVFCGAIENGDSFVYLNITIIFSTQDSALKKTNDIWYIKGQ